MSVLFLFNAKYNSWQSTKHTVFGFALTMIFLVEILGIKKETFFKWIIFFYPKKWGRGGIWHYCIPLGPQHEACITVSLYASSISWFLMAKSNETKESFLFRIAIRESEKKCCFAVNSLLLAHLDRGEGPPHFSFLIFSKGKNRGFDLLSGVVFLSHWNSNRRLWVLFL